MNKSNFAVQVAAANALAASGTALDLSRYAVTVQSLSSGAVSGSGDITMADGKNIILNTTTGSKIGTAITQKLAFFNSTPIVQRAGAAQAAVVTTAATQTTPFGYATGAQADAIVTLVNELRAALVAFGLIKGAA